MSDPAKSPASKLLLALRARKSAARRSGGGTPSPAPSTSSDCKGVHQLLARHVKEHPGSEEKEEEEEVCDGGRPPGYTPRSLEQELENIKLENKEEEKLEDNKVEEEKKVEDEKTRHKIYAELILAREKLTRAKNHKEVLKELYESRKKNSVNMDWKNWSFAEMREEYVR